LNPNAVDVSVNLSDSYFPIASGPILKPIKPKAIPKLDLRKVEVIQ
jgi:hypothetical protein